MANITIPIIAAAMNQVSDSTLAIACRRAGILPSISFMNCIDKDTHRIDWNIFENEVKKFNDSTGSSDLIISIGTKTLLFKSVREKLIQVFDNIGYSHLEIIPLNDLNFTHVDFEKQYKARLDELANIKAQLSNPIIYWKSIGLKGAMQTLEYANFIDGIILKGENGAGTIAASYGNLEYNIKTIKETYPNLKIVASGGISTNADIKRYLKLGADQVAIGTLFAASEESKIALESKKEYINKSANDLSLISGYQSGIMFKKLDKDDANNTYSLREGMQSPKSGHLFAGKAIEHIDNIQSVSAIVEKLWPTK